MDPSAVAIVLGLLVCVVVAIIPAIRLLIAQRPRPHREPDGPAWWPEFEREFARYVALGEGDERTAR